MRKHNENVNARKFRTQSYIKNGICPECGGKLVIRNGKFGPFYGCSNYPKCKFTINK
ncbi:topoisomerase DNA-binding C4 zinc finger domain-containing protein [Leyella stercorea]|uniref:topoisomerase DNA-binding C4 zinc finger domain-containing protein n=2 Tax=Prevotellaceae TaxID=171552 RepID=UPI0024310362|nr:topoisomerase DNA-binding C4 zinc finger domain-containing protein [Leyella stercorea]